MKRSICILALCLVLSACANDTQNSSDEAVTTTATTTTEADSSAPEASSKPEDRPKPAEKMTINAEVLSYKNGVMTFTYGGEEYSLPFSRNDFDKDSVAIKFDYLSLSERIINNRLGETVNARLTVNNDISKILKCDVITPNGQKYQGEYAYVKDQNGKDYINTDLLYSFKRKEGSLCEISNINETLELDLNDLEMIDKLDYPESVDLVAFSCYKFNDGKMLLTDLYIYAQVFGDPPEEIVYSNVDPAKREDPDNRLGFFGVIQSIGDDGKTITVLLNDKKTLLTVPTYFNDGGELKEGMEIMVMVVSDSSLFGSGGTHEFGHAVIYTDPEFYNQTGWPNEFIDDSHLVSQKIAFADLAYARPHASTVNFKYTRVKDAG